MSSGGWELTEHATGVVAAAGHCHDALADQRLDELRCGFVLLLVVTKLVVLAVAPRVQRPRICR